MPLTIKLYQFVGNAFVLNFQSSNFQVQNVINFQYENAFHQ